MADSKPKISGYSRWWQNRIIRTKILIGIFVGVFIYQSVSTAYQMQKVEEEILMTYNDKALNLSVAVDCIMLKDGILFFNLLDRIGRTEVVGIKIDDNHPSCVERESFLQRMKSAHFSEFEQQARLAEPAIAPVINEPDVQTTSADLEVDEVIEVVDEIEDAVAGDETPIPIGLTFDSSIANGKMETTEIVIDGNKRSQILYTVKLNGVETTFDLTDLPQRKFDQGLSLTMTALGNLIVLSIIIWVMSGQIVGPLKRLTGFTQGVIRSGAVEKGDKITLVRNTANDEIGILTRAFNQMISRLQKSYRQIIKSKAAIGDLLDNTGQGFFSFGPDYKIHEEYSKACGQFFQHDIKGMDSLDLMVPDKKADVKQLMDLLFTGVGDLKLLEDLLPREIEMHGKILSMEYRFIPSANKDIADKMMVILTDVTQERELERQLKKDELINELIIRIARDKDGFIQFVQETNDIFNQVADDLKFTEKKFDKPELMRQFHTIKGVSGSFGLMQMAEQAHEFEEMVQNFDNSKESYKKLRDQIGQMTYSLRSSLDHVQDIVTWEEIDQSRTTIYKIPYEKLERFESIFDHTKKIKINEIKDAIESLKRQPIKSVFKKFASTAENLAEKLGKEINVIMRGTETEVPYDRLTPLFDSMIHLVRNSVDHGIEEPDIRKMIGKSEKGSLVFEAKAQNGNVHLIISDDGTGIDPNTVKQNALNKGIIEEKELGKLDDDEAVKLIFKPGFSTATVVSGISGRGVGMDAVKTVLNNLKGSISIKTKKEQGTTFRLVVPI